MPFTKLAALASLPSGVESMPMHQRYPKGDAFVDYFQTAWLDGNVLLKMWNYHYQECPHTNNHLEGGHNWLKRAARKAYPNMFEFIKRLQNEQAARGDHPAVVRRRKILFKGKKHGAA